MDVLVCREESLGLASAQVIQVCINTASLNDVSLVKISLAVTDEVNFFADQF